MERAPTRTMSVNLFGLMRPGQNKAIWHSNWTLFLNVKFRFYKPFNYKRNIHLTCFSKLQRYNHQNKSVIICHFRRCRDLKLLS